MKCLISFWKMKMYRDYLDEQKAVPCKEGDFELASTLDGMKSYHRRRKNGRLSGSLLSYQKCQWTHMIQTLSAG